MKKQTKVIGLLLCAVLLVAGAVMGTLAYLTSDDTVTNTFSVGSVGISMDEADVNEAGQLLDNEGDVYEDGAQLASRVDGNAYHLLPGHYYVKDPTIHIDDDSEEAYLYVKLVIEDNADLVAALEKYGLSPELNDLLDDLDADDWICMDSDEADDGTRTYLLVYHETIDGKTANITLFTGFTVPEEFKNEDLESILDLNMMITAYAVQADGFGKTTDTFVEKATDAWGSTFGKSTP